MLELKEIISKKVSFVDRADSKLQDYYIIFVINKKPFTFRCKREGVWLILKIAYK
jgi:hypothetical protein